MSAGATFRHRAEGVLALVLFRFFGLLPLPVASAIGGWLGRSFGPGLGITRHARRNLRLAMPELDENAVRAVIRRMWDNLGRVLAEYPHIPQIRMLDPDGPVRAEGIEHVRAGIATGRPTIFFSAHYGNWEILSLLGQELEVPTAQVYRSANNPFVERLLREWRESLGVDPIPKGPHGARRILSAIRRGKALAILVDQKMNDGIAVPFFGIDAMTAPAIAELALRYDALVFPARTIRERGARFRVIFDPPLTLPPKEERDGAALAFLTRINAIIEGWIREDPGLWFWLHRRWPEPAAASDRQ